MHNMHYCYLLLSLKSTKNVESLLNEVIDDRDASSINIFIAGKNLCFAVNKNIITLTIDTINDED